MPRPTARAGNRNCRLVIQRPADPPVLNAANDDLHVFEDVLTVSAEKLPANATERLAAAQAQSEIAGKLRFPRSNSLARLNAAWRAIEATTGRILNLVGPYDPDGRNREWEVPYTESGHLETGFCEVIDNENQFALIDAFGTNFSAVE